MHGGSNFTLNILPHLELLELCGLGGYHCKDGWQKVLLDQSERDAGVGGRTLLDLLQMPLVDGQSLVCPRLEDFLVSVPL